MAQIQPRMFYLSRNAYGYLVGLAQRNGYVPFGSDRVKGLSKFLNDLAVFPLQDTRPALVRERHLQEIAYNHAPTWLQSRNRRGRVLSLSDEAIARYFKVAFQVGIIRAEPYAIGGPSKRTPFPSVAYVLEAIGLQWLTPEGFPKGHLE